MEKLATVFGGIFLTLSGIFLTVIFGTLFGAIAGWVVGFVFSDTILSVAAKLGLHDMTMWQFGAFLGFVGGFLKTKVSAEVKSKAA